MRLGYKIQSIIAHVLIKVDHTFDSELLNSPREDKYSQLQTYCWAHEIKAQRNLALHVTKMRRNCCHGFSKKGTLCDNNAKVLGHSTGGEPPSLWGGLWTLGPPI